MTERRRVIANMSLTLEGSYAGPGGPTDLGWVMPYAVTDVARDHMTRTWESATTALMGRVNAEGFLGYWPTVASDESAEPRDRSYARWLIDVDKVVLSTTLTEAPWPRTVIKNAPAAEVVGELLAAPGGDIVVHNSASVITALLAADRIDRLMIMIFPELVGGGARLFGDGLPPSSWELRHCVAGEHGALSLTYDRRRG